MADHPDQHKYYDKGIMQSAQAKPDSIDDLYNKVMGPNAAGKGKPVRSVENKGAIGLMVLPQGWETGPSNSGVRGAGYYESYHPPGAPDVKISVSYNGQRQDKATAEHFLRAVDKRSAARSPDLTKDEQAGLAGVFGLKADPSRFQLDTSTTEIIDGKRVLVTSGIYKTNSVRESTAYIDADGKGTTIQEISLQSPAAAFSRYEPQFKEMLHKLIWKP